MAGAQVINLPTGKLGRSPIVQNLVDTATKTANQLANLRKKQREARTEAAMTSIGGAVGGAAAAAVVDRVAPSLLGFKPSLLVGAALAFYGTSEDDLMAASAAGGMLSPHVYMMVGGALGAMTAR